MPIPATLIPLLIKAVPVIIRTFQSLRAKNPDATDDEIFQMTAATCARIIEPGEAWLEAHPEPTEGG